MSAISQQLGIILQKLDAIDMAIIALKTSDTIKIKVTHMPPDIFMAAVTLFSTFLGAISAYQVTAFTEWLKSRNERIDKVNYAFNTLLINLNTLLNFKRQFLIRRNDLIEVIMNYSGKFNLIPSQELRAQRESVLLPALNVLRDEGVDEVFVKWDELEFPKLFDQENLIFMIDYRPDDLRIFDIVRDQLQTINRSIKLRNELWPALLTEVIQKGFPPDISNMGILYEFLVYRRNVKEAADFAIAAIIESLERITEYQNVKFTSPKIFGIRLAPKFVAVKWSIPPNAAALIPDRSKYESALRRPEVKKR